MKRLLAGLVVVAALSACSTPPVTHTISGSFVLSGQATGTVGRCTGTGGFDDFGPGMAVTVRNQTDVVIATATTRSVEDLPLSRLDLVDANLPEARNQDGSPVLSRRVDTARCIVWFDVTEVPDAPFYSVQVGSRGQSTYSREDLIASNWTVALSLGR